MKLDAVGRPRILENPADVRPRWVRATIAATIGLAVHWTLTRLAGMAGWPAVLAAAAVVAAYTTWRTVVARRRAERWFQQLRAGQATLAPAAKETVEATVELPS